MPGAKAAVEIKQRFCIISDSPEPAVCRHKMQVRTHPGFPELVPGAKAAVEGREATFVDMDPPQHTHFRWGKHVDGVDVIA
jgi:hypothetical protein